MKKTILFILITTIAISSIAMAVNFSDISGHWAEKFIVAMADKGVINGYPDGTYKPDSTLTYGEFIRLIVAASLPNTDISELENPSGHWAGTSLTVLENYGIMEKGLNTEEFLNSKITRIEVVRILSECDIKMRLSSQKTTSLEFTDIKDIKDSEKTLLRHAVARGVISGDPTGEFRPNAELKRSEVAKILYEYSK